MTKEKLCNKDHSYNGWSNYETWCINLWLTNDQGTSQYLSDLATDKNTQTYEKSSVLKDYVLELMPDLGATMFADLLNSALSEVSWSEIIDNHEQDND